MNVEQAWLLFQRTGLPEAYSLYRELRERQQAAPADAAEAEGASAPRRFPLQGSRER